MSSKILDMINAPKGLIFENVDYLISFSQESLESLKDVSIFIGDIVSNNTDFKFTNFPINFLNDPNVKITFPDVYSLSDGSLLRKFFNKNFKTSTILNDNSVIQIPIADSSYITSTKVVLEIRKGDDLWKEILYLNTKAIAGGSSSGQWFRHIKWSSPGFENFNDIVTDIIEDNGVFLKIENSDDFQATVDVYVKNRYQSVNY